MGCLGLTDWKSCYFILSNPCFRQESAILDREGRGSTLGPCRDGPGPPEEDLVQRVQAPLHHGQDQEEDGSHVESDVTRCHVRDRLEHSQGMSADSPAWANHQYSCIEIP